MTPPFYLRLKCAGALILLGAGGCTQLDPDSTRRQVQDRLEPLLAAVVHKRQAKPDGSTNLQLPGRTLYQNHECANHGQERVATS